MYQPSFWESDRIFSNIDVLIIGSGIVGLSAAIAMKKKQPRMKVVVVDRGFLPYGASTRNAGFACFGSLTELLDDLKRENESEVLNRVERRFKGLQKLRNLLGDQEISYEPLGGYELFTEADQESFSCVKDHIDFFNHQLKPITGLDQTYTICNEEIQNFGFRKVSSLIKNHGEGQIDTGKMMQGLIKLAQSLEVIIINGLPVKQINSEIENVVIRCEDGYEFRVKKCLVAGNGFAKNLLNNIDVEPARAQVLITKPISNLRIKGSFHYEAGYYYFRNVGDRLLIGGGRNLDFTGENTTSFGITAQIQLKLEELLEKIILPSTPFEIDMRWSGIMGMGSSKTPIIKQASPNIWCAVRMGGMGVAIGTLVGDEAAEMVLQSF